ncbi:MAG: hypothetical protein ACMXYC_01705 [Candidatus Woesearchaeota archaeon]
MKIGYILGGALLGATIGSMSTCALLKDSRYSITRQQGAPYVQDRVRDIQLPIHESQDTFYVGNLEHQLQGALFMQQEQKINLPNESLLEKLRKISLP